MKTFEVLKREDASEKTQEIFDGIKSKLGMVPNLYATIGYSPEILEAYLNFTHVAESQSFTNKETQAIYLAVSEANSCTYCLAVHTAIGKMNGFTDEDTYKLRNATIEDEKLNVLTTLAKEIAETTGRPSAEALDRFYGLGYTDQEFVEFLGLVNVKMFSNIFHNVTKIPVDFPEVKPLESVTV